MYGQQFSNVITSAAKWIFFGFFLVIFMGFLLGANLKDATWLNSDIAAAQAEKTRMETAHQEAMNKLQEQLAMAQTNADVQKIQNQINLENAQYEHDMKILAQDIINRQRWTDAGINLVVFVGSATGISAAIGAITIAIAKAFSILRAIPRNQPSERVLPEIKIVRHMPERVPYEPWHNKKYREAKVKEARYNEQTARNIALRKERSKMPQAD